MGGGRIDGSALFVLHAGVVSVAAEPALASRFRLPQRDIRRRDRVGLHRPFRVSGDLSPDRRALERRLDELSAQALTPGSSLACLDALAGDNVEAACEKALFVSPVSVASASSYVAARLTLLASMTAYAQRGGKDIEYALAPLRHSLEADRFGFVAHVLAARDVVHEPELQGACTSARSEPDPFQSQRTDA